VSILSVPREIGVQIVGRPWEEEVVLAVAAKLERESGS
jgi:Asp-tRNA(Asn)/Glu-tRNA(Gln) amidotransferase A subunit family amidase